MNKSMQRIVMLLVAFAMVMTLSVAVGAQKAAPAKAAANASGPVDINTASEKELEALPGVGKATAAKIIAGRPYTSVDDLAKAGVSKSTIAKITPLVTVSGAKRRRASETATPATSELKNPKTHPGAPATAPAPAPKPQEPSAAAEKTASTESATPAQVPPVKGMVWVNLSTKVYHYEGDEYYGKTKKGKFMNEEDAIKAGYRAAKSRTEKK